MEHAEQLLIEQLVIDGDELTPIVIYNRLGGKRKCLLESSDKTTGRYSIIGLDPVCTLKADDGVVTADRDGVVETLEGNDPVRLIEAFVRRHTPQSDLPFIGGAIGYVGYDMIRAYEQIGEAPESDRQLPDALLSVYDKVVLYDHHEHRVHLLYSSIGGERDTQKMKAFLDEMKEDILRPVEVMMEQPIESLHYEHRTRKSDFLSLVEQVKEDIRDGEIFQLVLSQRLDATFKGDAFHFYRQLRRANPSPYLFYIDLGEVTVIGASPESLVTVRGRRLTTNPIAGTRPRGRDEQRDAEYATELAADPKERAEHLMLLDLGRNDLGRVSEIGSIHIPKKMEIEKFRHVMHLVSVVEGELREGMTGADALIACLPAGTVSGAPKIRAMELIDRYEHLKREVYAGAVGYFDVRGDIDFALAIRTMVIKGGRASVQAGAGIVYDSDPAAEYEETLNKAKALLEVGR
ncbi:anthranilate synthase component I [Exiguobacterium flavidum]|uniref:anthranilate synthase component I n=1 Tax=Exiguobacterium flavidum TaxID=2184695 RepID=UPI000DF77989|nr:anthranilate synthase component I [Exiguobacterium flavidum]